MSTKTFNVSMSEDLVREIDKQAKEQGSNRSDFIRQSVRKQLTVLKQWQTVTQSMRESYKGKQLSEQEVADLVRRERKKSSKK